MDEKDERIPLNQVLDDMYNPDGGMVADAARCYFYEHYATDEQRERMDHEDRVNGIVATVVMVAYVTVIVIALVAGFINGWQ